LAETDGIKEIIKSGDAAAIIAAGDGEALPKPFKIRKQIGYTVYEVEARFNHASRETLDDKILRLVRGEAMKKGSEP
jgi:hypothetical protein